MEWRIKSSNTHENSSKLFSHRWKNEYFFSFHSRFPAHDSTTPSSRNLSQRRGTIVTYDTKRNDIYGFSVPLVSSSLCFHSIRNHSGIHRKAICRARHAHRACTSTHTRTRTRTHTVERRDREKKTGSRDKPELFARSLPQDRNNPPFPIVAPCTNRIF